MAKSKTRIRIISPFAWPITSSSIHSITKLTRPGLFYFSHIHLQLVSIKSPFSGQCNLVSFYIGSKMGFWWTPIVRIYNPRQEAEYLFSIRSLLDERVRLCSGGSDRYATSRLSLPYHIQVYNFLPRKTAKLNLSSGQSKAPSKTFISIFSKKFIKKF